MKEKFVRIHNVSGLLVDSYLPTKQRLGLSLHAHDKGDDTIYKFDVHKEVALGFAIAILIRLNPSFQTICEEGEISKKITD